ncbi:hypothetical protein C1Y11_01255 [Pseudomonas sp. FW305-20]|nr:hypothetical protein C1Y11_01255 [Pseudomonas sp. FW305-20]PMU22239.1 hypothetical protein C1Y10_00270 [Pseudomonas sp. FW305-122]PMU43443.1 hypothetical protein C1Y12_01470 [Pseudomonas sp. FW305-47B]PMX57753.1 hypothetical protein C1Y13_23245 [Pseudomonas sp. FW305-33]PMX64699.1 hypothetical protein C1X12_20415 [Pseudomonas sp. FW305-60]
MQAAQCLSATAILVGASLLAIADWQTTHLLNVRPLSRASSLPQVLRLVCLALGKRLHSNHAPDS